MKYSLKKLGQPSPILSSRGIKRSEAFTLVELLVTVALVALLMLAVTQVFSIASRTVGGAQALGAAVRDAQAAQTVFYRDLSAAAADSPFFVIRSSRAAAYRNLNDGLTDQGGGPMTFDFDGVGGEEAISPANYNFRNHRQDILVFCSRDRFRRQTGNDGVLVANQSAGEAMIWYGHLQLPNNGSPSIYSDSTFPGAGDPATNPNNFFASQWILGRAAMLLIDPDGKNVDGTGGTISGQHFFVRNSASAASLQPLSFSTVSDDSSGTILEGRYDLAGTSIRTFNQILTDHLTANATSPWWDALMTVRTAAAGTFRASPYQSRPLDSAAAARQVPIFVPACTQFIVEFAGDYVIQDWDPDANGTPDTTIDMNSTNLPNYGRQLSAGQDGRVDTVPGTRQIRWYGLPRDTNANGQIIAAEGDVVPVRDVAGLQSFERGTLPTIPTGPRGYLETGYTLNDYIVAWGPADAARRPKLIRVTIVIDRPEAEGKLLDGQTFEYVFPVGY